MSKGKNDIKTRYNWDSLRTYLFGSRKGRAANALEKEMENDVFLKEAIEGYENSGDDDIHSRNLKDIEDYVRYRESQESGAKSNLRTYSIAASIALLISASLFVWFGFFKTLDTQELSDMGETDKQNETQKENSIPEAKTEKQKLNADEEELSENIETEMLVKEADEIVHQENSNPETDIVSKDNEQEIKLKPAKSSDSYQSIQTVKTTEPQAVQLEPKFINEDLVNKILEQERDFWLADLEKNSSFSLREDDILSDMAESAETPSETRKLSKKMERSQRDISDAAAPSAAGASTSSEKENVTTLKAERITKVAMIDSLMAGKFNSGSALQEYSDNKDLDVILGIHSFMVGDTLKALQYLEKALPRNQNQRDLIDQLISHLKE